MIAGEEGLVPLSRPFSVRAPTLWLGAQEPWWAWNGEANGPVIISANRVRARCRSSRSDSKWRRGMGRPDKADVPVFVDSGAFTEVSTHGRWTISARDFAEEIEDFAEAIGGISHAGTQDWMCEPWIIEQTGLSMEAHQRRSVDSFLELSSISPSIPWVPTLQGYSLDDYLRCARMFEDTGVALADVPLVGLGSVCRRSNTRQISGVVGGIVSALPGIRLHGFGVKNEGVLRVLRCVASVDSMAWSLRARWMEADVRRALDLDVRAPWSDVERRAANVELPPALDEFVRTHRPVSDGGKRSAANDQAFAERWRERQLAAMGRANYQLDIFDMEIQ